MALDPSDFRRKYLLRLATRPWVLGPFVGGATLLFGLWSLSLREPGLALAALAGMLGAAGMFLTRLLLGKEADSQAVIAEMQREAAAQRERRIDELRERLSRDGDPRTGAALNDLVALVRAFQEHRSPASLGVRATLDMAAGVQELFEHCVASLDRGFELYGTARALASEGAKAPVLQERERIIGEVQESVAHLGKLLAAVQGMTGEAGAPAELARIRAELDQRLEVSRRVDERMRDLDTQLDPGHEARI